MTSRVVGKMKLHHFMDTWHTPDGRYQISAEGQGTTECGHPHMVRNGMMCPGKVEHMHNVWWVFDSFEATYPLGRRSFDTLSQAAVALQVHLEWRGR